MFKLSSLPIELLYLIGEFLEVNDLVTLGRLNTWFGYWISIIIGERISTSVQQEGWRIHIDILAKSYPIIQNAPSFPFATELLLLSEYSKINPFTLTLEFNLCPIDEDGLDAIKSATQSERSIVLFNKMKTNIDIVAYFAQISTNRRLQHVNQAGAGIMNDKNLWNQLENNNLIHGNMSIMGSAFKLQYEMTTQNKEKQDIVKLIEKFQNDYDKQSNETDALPLKKEDSAVISFDKIQVSPEWWIKQMKIPSCSSSSSSSSSNTYDEIQNSAKDYICEHAYW